MNYQLALTLKNAGFPQKFKNGNWFFEGFNVEAPNENSVMKPTLSELIEALGKDNWFQLHFYAGKDGLDKWEAQSSTGRDDLGVPTATGETPEIAVANLWLELHKNL